MLVSCLCVCHAKPDTTHEAIQSIINQSYPHWEALIVDSGALYDAGYYDRFAWRHDPRVKLIRSAETNEIRRTKAMAPWCYNECFRKGLVSGDLITYLCDDDILYPNAFATFVTYACQNPQAKAMYASQDIAVIYPNGWRAIIGERRATRPGGRCCNGRRMDCHVDYLQFCHEANVLRLLAGHEYWPESKDSESHADGIFMERIGEQVPIYPIDVKVSQNRRTPQSANVPVQSFALIECMANGIPFLASQTGMASRKSAATEDTEGVQTELPLVTISVAVGSRAAGLSDTLASVAVQTYANLEVLVMDYGSADRESTTILETMRSRYPQFRFLKSSPAAQYRGLWAARGVYFVPMDAGMLACPDMAERFVAAILRHPDLSAMTCYVLGLRDGRCHAPATDNTSSLSTEECGLLASPKNLSGSGIYKVADLRNSGGYGTELPIPDHDWLGFFKLVNGGYRVDILPEHLFYHRSPDDTSVPPCDARLLRPFFEADRLLAAERVALWTAFTDMQQRLGQMQRRVGELAEQNRALQIRCGSLSHQVADRVAWLGTRVPFARRSIRWLLSLSS